MTLAQMAQSAFPATIATGPLGAPLPHGGNGDDQNTFLEAIREHQVELLHADGYYRHLRVGRPGKPDYRWEVVTWPGHLRYTGDLGAFTFCRLADMFVFFRRDPSRSWDEIPYGYWAEKCISEDRGGGVKVYTYQQMEGKHLFSEVPDLCYWTPRFVMCCWALRLTIAAFDRMLEEVAS